MEKGTTYQTLEKGLGNLIVDKDSRYILHNCKLDILVKENTNLELVNFRGCDLDEALNIRLERGASLKVYNIVITSSNVFLKENIYLEKENSQCDITSVLLATDDAVLESDINIYHYVKNTTSTFENYGIARGCAKMTLNNNATIKQGASKAVVMQKAKGLTLSKEAKIIAMPNLYIDEYDVIANHSAAIGSISNEDLFYLMSRGLSKENATSLVVIGFIKPIIDNITDESLKEKIFNDFMLKLSK